MVYLGLMAEIRFFLAQKTAIQGQLFMTKVSRDIDSGGGSWDYLRGLPYR
ncbi:hypothetical protein C943_02118 [Mariniradius saccharolyticus AK6]|uniref:Uncharacterized protein n=1 Tax=Mariniradius saccharolyticus AK6 TaxID=1239962 RepID=M7XA08_9BACT|nr:hypothetical protein C943_02118 [Mariniradius saccharolyticus AK6]